MNFSLFNYFNMFGCKIFFCFIDQVNWTFLFEDDQRWPFIQSINSTVWISRKKQPESKTDQIKSFTKIIFGILNFSLVHCIVWDLVIHLSLNQVYLLFKTLLPVSVCVFDLDFFIHSYDHWEHLNYENFIPPILKS